MKTIVHIINADRFTSGYINFMKLRYNFIKHRFIFLDKLQKLILSDYENIYPIESYLNLIVSHKFKSMLSDADQIIISGVFNIDLYYILLPDSILKKTYLHFWGGDFYQFNKKLSIRKSVHKSIMCNLIRRCKGCIFLIEGEGSILNKIFNITKESFIAGMPNDPLLKIDFDSVLSQVETKKNRILVGNSATPSNNHEEVFSYLKSYKSEYPDLEVMCPLSYGDDSYRKKILKIGIDMLGDSFFPILDSMDIFRYTELLGTCEVAIFNTNRQQAMGNINLLLNLGKKVYIRDDTTMWKNYINMGYAIYSFNVLTHKFDDTFFIFDNKLKQNNIQISEENSIKSNDILTQQWKNIFDLY